MMGSRRRQMTTMAAAVAAGLALAGCGSSSDSAQRVALASVAVQPSASEPPKPTAQCVIPNLKASLRPSGALPAPGQMPAGSYMATILHRGRLIAGVDQNTRLFAYLNPVTGQFAGAEIDLVRELAKAIFGDPNAVDFRALTTQQRLPAVENGNVDVVVDAVSITCARRKQVDFSTVYYDAGQRVLVPTSSSAGTIRDLKGKRVCATKGSTTYDNLAHYPVIRVPVAQRTDCLVGLQETSVDAISSDDTILLGLQSQDPYTKVIGPRLTDEPYGMAIARTHPDFVRFVNGVLEQLRTGGGWSRIFHRWLGGAAPPPPRPQYER
jgi:polar amino acid transport system substrate-binding protein